MHDRHTASQGVAYALTAYLVWGFFPIYFKLTSAVPALEVLCHRVVWSCAFLLLLCHLTGRRRELANLWRDLKTVRLLGITALLISINWLVFIYAVESGRILESSLGYFINPLVNALLGRLFLQERMTRPQQIALLLAAAGVATRIILLGKLPWIALILAFSFALYGLLRKAAKQVDAIVGLTVETTLVVIPALAYLLCQNADGRSASVTAPAIVTFLLVFSGIVTALPLLCFAAAAKRLRLTTVGFLQYLTPTLHLVIAVALYGEPFTLGNLASFALIWGGIALYTLAALQQLRAAR